MTFDEIIESLINDAQERGEFDDLPGKGKPIDLTEYFEAPEEVRVAQALLKNAGMVPVEIELLGEIATLKESLREQKDQTEKDESLKLLKEKQLQFNLLVERRKS